MDNSNEKVVNTELQNDINEGDENTQKNSAEIVNQEADTVKEETIETEEEVEEGISNEHKKGFFYNLGGIIIDQCICLLVSMGLVLLLHFLLPSFGYQISNASMMTLAIYVIINILYSAVLLSTKNGKTVGSMIFK